MRGLGKLVQEIYDRRKQADDPTVVLIESEEYITTEAKRRIREAFREAFTGPFPSGNVIIKRLQAKPLFRINVGDCSDFCKLWGGEKGCLRKDDKQCFQIQTNQSSSEVDDLDRPDWAIDAGRD